MEHNNDLARLEKFVDRLLDSHNQLKNENSGLNAQLQAKQQEIAELQEMIKNLQEDRIVMHNRVTGLIGRIDEWEKTFDQEGPGQDSNSVDNEIQGQPKKSSSLFKAPAEQSSGSLLR